MARIKDEEREHRIHYEIIVDAYDEYEQAMGWYYHFAEKLKFPIKAVINLPLRGGKTEKKTVEIVEVDPKSETNLNLRLGIVEGTSKRVQYISPEQIESVQTTDENVDVLNDWLYWHDYKLL
ncbi:MAG: calcium-binding protein [Saprospiraceae bacterium]|nr:calcium-binding protein [Saprospiraceae bacterium]